MNIVRSLVRKLAPKDDAIPEATEGENRLLGLVSQYSMTGRLRLWSFLQALRHVDRHGIPGDIVECGVYKGGNLILAGLTTNRPIWGYDTFEGMSEPTDHDTRLDGPEKVTTKEKWATTDDWCAASIYEVEANFGKYASKDRLNLIKGKVEDTLQNAANIPDRIAVLRLDTDWYESTKVELETLYPRLVPGGVLIIDDYGHWAGAKKAVDEYFQGQIWLHRIDNSCRLAIKL